MIRSQTGQPRFRRLTPRWMVATALLAASAISPGLVTGADVPTAIRSRDVELHYRVTEKDLATMIDLWYTRDRGATWKRYGEFEPATNPIIFTAPAEGLYGFLLAPRLRAEPTASAPAGYASPQRWVFVDYTPPLVQWDAVEAISDDPANPKLQLRWTAYDDNFESRPVALAYETSVDQTWRVIEPAVPNLGRYDWTPPSGLSGQLTLRLTVHDLGGHIVERLHGPMPLHKLLGIATSRPASQPAAQAVATSKPSTDAVAITPGDRLKAEELYRQGSWNLARGQYAVAAERFREALQLDPGMLMAMNDLAGIHATQKDYDKAIELYTAVLSRDPRHAQALRGLALVHALRRQYPHARDSLKRLLDLDSKDAQAWLDLGDVTFMMYDTAEARARWSEALRLAGPSDAVAKLARRRLEAYPPGPQGTAAAQPRQTP